MNGFKVTQKPKSTRDEREEGGCDLQWIEQEQRISIYVYVTFGAFYVLIFAMHSIQNGKKAAHNIVRITTKHAYWFFFLFFLNIFMSYRTLGNSEAHNVNISAWMREWVSLQRNHVNRMATRKWKINRDAWTQ